MDTCFVKKIKIKSRAQITGKKQNTLNNSFVNIKKKLINY